ncbi:hypothetical protein JKP88DRAFT_177974 [Tribonema minus]|uniref:EGF-like domain-containing protein n=1 Tax=Tribonema minus TaxID=303371 RepID=A0A835ZG45_9STRA|nr:hypothetical protein JKP88DRAFT_177974 [Tribonema minus]
MRLLLQLLVLAALQQTATAVCPNFCSGHGTCGPENTCACNDGWTAAVDCSLRNCPLGAAWADKAYATDKAHADVECSGAGICDGETGECQCFTPYVGSACQRLRCPNDCSSHGVCMTMADVVRYYGALGSTYDNWDKDSTTMCVCDAGYFGSDCTKRMCPKGDDPLTIGQASRQIEIEISSTATLVGGTFDFMFNGQLVTIATNAGDDACEAVSASAAYCHCACMMLVSSFFLYYSHALNGTNL